MLDLIESKRRVVGAVTDGRREEDTALIEGVVRALRGRPVRHLRAVS
jgi:SWI/SNF-related matrix-associated actin-dependent regulator of chromatin subfamily A-like protein 1